DHAKRVFTDSFAAGAIFIMGLYHIVIFIYRRKNRSALFLGLFSMAMVVRLIVLGETVISLLFPSLPWEVILRGDLISVPLGCLFFYFYISSLCKDKIVPAVSAVFLVLFVASSAAYAFLPVSRSNYLGMYMPYIFGAGMIYITICVARCTINREEGMPYLVLGLVLLFTAGFNDTLHASGIIYTDFIMPYGFALFCVTQSFLLADFGAKSQKSLELLSSDLSAALEASNVISGEIEVERFLSKMLDIVVTNSGADACAYIGVREGGLNVEAAFGYGRIREADVKPVSFREFGRIPENVVSHVLSTGKPLVIDDLSADPVFSSGLSDQMKGIRAVYCLPILSNDSVQGILYLENNQHSGAFDSRRLVMSGLLSSQIRISLENARMYDDLEAKVRARTATIEKQKAVLESNQKMMNGEIRTAETILRSLLPQNLCIPESAELSYSCVPMSEVGGDFVSVKLSKDRSQMLIFICDVSGHGIAAALLASMISISLDALWDEGKTSPLVLFGGLRQRLAPKLGKLFFSASACCIDLLSGRCIMASAGHPPVIVARKDGSFSMMRPEGKIIAHNIDPNLQESGITLLRGDCIVLYTDGVTEARNAGGDLFGADEESFGALIQRQLNSLPFDAVCSAVIDEVTQFTGCANFDDDLTILAFRYKG
ncbi:MAG: SpoIIE family protein phosphatase, partial [Spirochaetota bacterium]